MDLRKGQEGRLQFACVAQIVRTELALLVGDVYLCIYVRVKLSPVTVPVSPLDRSALWSCMPARAVRYLWGALARAVFPILSPSQVLGGVLVQMLLLP